jgi:hypothetical protein
MNVMMWEHCTFDSKIFGCGKVYYSNSPIITILHKLSFPTVGLKMSSLPTLALKSPKKNSYGIWGIDRIHILIFHRTVLPVINFILCWSMNIQSNDITPATS